MNSSFDLVLTVSEEVRRACIRMDKIPEDKICTLYNGIELSRISQVNGAGQLPNSLKLAPHAPVILTVGHIRHVKGIDVLVEVAAKVVPEFPQCDVHGHWKKFRPCTFSPDRWHALPNSELVQISDFSESPKISSLCLRWEMFSSFLPGVRGFSNALNRSDGLRFCRAWRHV